MAIGSLLKRLHKANFVQGSMYERNVLVQPGPLNVPPADRSFSEPSYRIIDFGRGLGLGINRSSLQDIKSEVETEQGYARDQRLIPSGRRSRRCDTDLRDLMWAAHIFTKVIRAFGRPSALPPPPPPPHLLLLLQLCMVPQQLRDSSSISRSPKNVVMYGC